MRAAIEYAPAVAAARGAKDRAQQNPPIVREAEAAGKPQLSLFDTARWPQRPYCTDDFEAGVRVRSLAQAVTRRYLQANPPHMRVWSIHDIDRGGAAAAWEDADLPPPAWTAVNKANGHAHSVWGLSAPVLVAGLGARDAPMRYLCAVESMMRERLRADAGYSGLITKNPMHPHWLLLRGPRLAYTLGELAEYLPGIERHVPRRPERVGLGRNVTLFDELRRWSYRAIRGYWGGGLAGWNDWVAACNGRALAMNADLFGVRLLDHREVWHIAKSAAKWTWRHFTPADFSRWQAAAGRRAGAASGAARRQGTPLEHDRQPWVAEGLSRRTWYRHSAGVDPGAARREGSIAEQQPWVAEGVSRRTWYRRRASGVLVPEGAEPPTAGPRGLLSDMGSVPQVVPRHDGTAPTGDRHGP